MPELDFTPDQIAESLNRIDAYRRVKTGAATLHLWNEGESLGVLDMLTHPDGAVPEDMHKIVKAFLPRATYAGTLSVPAAAGLESAHREMLIVGAGLNTDADLQESAMIDTLRATLGAEVTEIRPNSAN